MRYKVSNPECTHLWAHKAQDHAEGPTVFFEGDSIYSYGHHFEMARHVKGSRGRTAVIITARSYSPTTAKHLSDVRYATNHLTAFRVPLISESRYAGKSVNVNFGMDYFADRIKQNILKAAKARKYKEYHLDSARQFAAQANEFAEFFGSKRRLALPENFEEAMAQAKAESDRIAKAERIQRERRRIEQEKRDAIAREEAIKAIPEWRAGRINYIPNQHLLNQTFLRLIDDGQTVQTSRGAQFPAESNCQKSWMKSEPQAAIFVPSLKITPAITAGSNVLPFNFRQWF